MVVGSGGSGKSTFSQMLGKELNLPVYHLDSLYWQPGWSRTPSLQWAGILRELCKREYWIIDGNYTNTLDIRLEACDTVVFLDVNRLTCILRVVKRTFTSKSRPDMGIGCEERFDLEFIKFLWNYPGTTRPVVIEKLNSIKNSKTVIISKSGMHALQLCKNN